MPKKKFEQLGNGESVKRRVLTAVIFCPKVGFTINDRKCFKCAFNQGKLNQNQKNYILCSYREG